jgi:hypothetical protein
MSVQLSDLRSAVVKEAAAAAAAAAHLLCALDDADAIGDVVDKDDADANADAADAVSITTTTTSQFGAAELAAALAAPLAHLLRVTKAAMSAPADECLTALLRLAPCPAAMATLLQVGSTRFFCFVDECLTARLAPCPAAMATLFNRTTCTLPCGDGDVVASGFQSRMSLLSIITHSPCAFKHSLLIPCLALCLLYQVASSSRAPALRARVFEMTAESLTTWTPMQLLQLQLSVQETAAPSKSVSADAAAASSDPAVTAGVTAPISDSDRCLMAAIESAPSPRTHKAAPSRTAVTAGVTAPTSDTDSLTMAVECALTSALRAPSPRTRKAAPGDSAVTASVTAPTSDSDSDCLMAAIESALEALHAPSPRTRKAARLLFAAYATVLPTAAMRYCGDDGDDDGDDNDAADNDGSTLPSPLTTTPLSTTTTTTIGSSSSAPSLSSSMPRKTARLIATEHASTLPPAVAALLWRRAAMATTTTTTTTTTATATTSTTTASALMDMPMPLKGNGKGNGKGKGKAKKAKPMSALALAIAAAKGKAKASKIAAARGKKAKQPKKKSALALAMAAAKAKAKASKAKAASEEDGFVVAMAATRGKAKAKVNEAKTEGIVAFASAAAKTLIATPALMTMPTAKATAALAKAAKAKAEATKAVAALSSGDGYDVDANDDTGGGGCKGVDGAKQQQQKRRRRAPLSTITNVERRSAVEATKTNAAAAGIDKHGNDVDVDVGAKKGQVATVVGAPSLSTVSDVKEVSALKEHMRARRRLRSATTSID